ncbi:precorrin-6y C5,15-methyltransferase (decarboxylating) subunit CbiE [Aureimonas jatrophae]|uniref:Precorrin-6Y C5,15-methyltransferase (Decarboxylating) n=1 Tax=Aureimonas jatrophae TaxID=1166073 RepID=A0A1H0D7R6_9HYPH|nr:precorrin-6y C5,15-methyltransferase (decarboxylating) subunit CbiE [Aureimonas jatrophae]MBB3951749.1 precorrin-6Y C5,15-methyltransferase (decarboxylating) [Aureimonas jatrophae]SDN66232.1 precorrin-6Y C5,15-methyltransferase (decarboxylating) [Aureimonas jatrophae]
MTAPWLHVIGISDGGLDTLTPEARHALDGAEIVFGGERHLAMLGNHPARRISWRSPFAESAADILAARGTPAAVLATGDPSWFGPVRWLRTFLDAGEMRVLPAPSAFSLAAARMGWALETVRCLTVHGRAVETVNPHVAPGARLLVLSEDGASPALVADLLRRRGYGASRITVLEHMGGAAERVREGEAEGFALEGIAALNTLVVDCRADEGTPHHPFATGLPDDAFRHDGKMTKRVPRALALAALAPGAGELLWDVGAGSGSICVEWLRAAPGARAVAIEPIAERRAMIAENAFRLGTHGLRIVEGRAPAAFADLPAPDAVFIGGGLTDGVFHAAFAALKPGGRLVAHAVTLESEAILLALHEVHGGELLRVAVSHAEPVGPYRGWRPAMPVTHWSLRKVRL